MYQRRNIPSRRSQLGYLFVGAKRSLQDPRPRFSPRSLFRNGEQGAWYDPSDFSSMYQDSIGTTPVTAVEQPVGLLLDKRRGLAGPGSNVVTTPFDGTWDSSDGTLVGAGGVATATNSSGFLRSPDLGTVLQDKFFLVTGECTVVSGSFTINAGGVEQTASIAVSGPFERRVRVQFFPANQQVYIIGSAFTGTVGNLSVREIPGNHASQATAASRPLLQQDASGYYYLAFDGVDDGVATASIDFTATDKVTVIAGVHKASDAATGMLVELSASGAANAGTFNITAPPGAAVFNYGARCRGSVDNLMTTAQFPAPHTGVLTLTGDIAGDAASLRVNGAQAASSTADQGAGNFGSYPLYIGRRGGSSLPFEGRLYSLIVRGAASTAAQIAAAERYMAGKAGVTL